MTLAQIKLLAENGHPVQLHPQTVLNLLGLLEEFAGLANEAISGGDVLQIELDELLAKKEGDL